MELFSILEAPNHLWSQQPKEHKMQQAIERARS